MVPWIQSVNSSRLSASCSLARVHACGFSSTHMVDRNHGCILQRRKLRPGKNNLVKVQYFRTVEIIQQIGHKPRIPDVGLSTGIPYRPLSLPKLIPEYRAKSNFE